MKTRLYFAFLFSLLIAKAFAVNEECAPTTGNCIGSDNVIRSFESTAYEECMALCQSLTGCENITWLHVSDTLGSCHILTSCDSLDILCSDCTSSGVCFRPGPVVKLGTNEVDITLEINNKEWMR